MSAKDSEYPPETQNTSATIPAVLAFVGGVLLAAIVMYLIVVAPRSSDRAEAAETIAELEDELARLDGRDAELRETAASLDSALDEERARLSALEEENQTLRIGLEEARALGVERGETIERLERELAELAAAMAAVEALEARAAEAFAEVESLEAIIEERDAELEEVRQAHLAALDRVEHLEAEQEEIREELQREMDALERSLVTVPEEPEAAAPVTDDPYRLIRLLSSAIEARQEGIMAEDPEREREALTRADEFITTIEAEFPERSVERLRR